MPRRSRSKVDYGKKKNYAKKQKTTEQRVAYSAYNGIVPSTRKTSLRYVGYYDLTDAITGFSTQVMRANSVFDPDASGVGHQPRGFDELKVLYDHYRVLKSSITVHACQRQATQPTMISLAPTQFVTPIGPGLAEYPGAKNMMLSEGGSGPSVKSLTCTINIAKFDGDPGAKVDDALAAGVGANPLDEQYFQICAWNPSTGTTCDARIVVIVDYYVQFWGRQDLLQS